MQCFEGFILIALYHTYVAMNNSASKKEYGTTLINGTLEALQNEGGGYTLDELGRRVQRNAKLQGNETESIKAYVSLLQAGSHTCIAETLPATIGGKFDGSRIFINYSTLQVGSHIGEATARIQEVIAHEVYHAVHHHTDPVVLATHALQEHDSFMSDVPSSEPEVIIGNEEFTYEEVVEGLTVTETGEEFVSTDYRGYGERIQSALVRSHLSMNNLRRAVNEEKDLTLVDDRTNVQSFAQAA